MRLEIAWSVAHARSFCSWLRYKYLNYTRDSENQPTTATGNLYALARAAAWKNITQVVPRLSARRLPGPRFSPPYACRFCRAANRLTINCRLFSSRLFLRCTVILPRLLSVADARTRGLMSSVSAATTQTRQITDANTRVKI
jgi:hypothetical protein